MDSHTAPESPLALHYMSEFSLHSDFESSDEDGDFGGNGSGHADSAANPPSKSNLNLGDVEPHNMHENGKGEDTSTRSILRYQGYLKVEHDVTALGYQILREGRDLSSEMVDFLLAHAHAVQYERRRTALSRVIILPTSFGGSLAAHLRASDGQEKRLNFETSVQQLGRYSLKEIWGTSLLLVPIYVGHQWVLLAVTNAFLAVHRGRLRPDVHDVLVGDRRPDREPFSILLLSSSPATRSKAVLKMPDILRKFLEVTWAQLHSTSLEFVNSYSVRCPEQADSASSGLHVIHNVEVLMREGVTDKIRKASQRVLVMGLSVWSSIFEPTIMHGPTYRQLKAAVVQQEMLIYAKGMSWSSCRLLLNCDCGVQNRVMSAYHRLSVWFLNFGIPPPFAFVFQLPPAFKPTIVLVSHPSTHLSSSSPTELLSCTPAVLISIAGDQMSPTFGTETSPSLHPALSNDLPQNFNTQSNLTASIPHQESLQVVRQDVVPPCVTENPQPNARVSEVSPKTGVAANEVEAPSTAVSSRITFTANPPTQGHPVGASVVQDEAQKQEEKRRRKEEKKRLRKEEKKTLPKEERRALKEARQLERTEKKRRKAEKRQRSPSPIPLDGDTGNTPISSEDRALSKPERKKAKIHTEDVDEGSHHVRPEDAGDVNKGSHHVRQEEPPVATEKRKHAELDAHHSQVPAPAKTFEDSTLKAGVQNPKRRRLETPMATLSTTSAPLPLAAVHPAHNLLTLPDITNALSGGLDNATLNGVAQVPHAGRSTAHPSKSGHSGNPVEPHGFPMLLDAPLQGYFATRYYPDRKAPLQVPTGKLTPEAVAERYRGLNDDQIQECQARYLEQSKTCSKVFQDAFKHTERGRLDKYPHLWLVPRLHNYYYTTRDGRSALLDRIIRDLIQEFPDLHPNFLQLRDTSMEKEYLTALRNIVFVAISGIKNALQNPSKVENIDKDVIKHLSGTGTPQRPHDLWMRDQLAKIKVEESAAAERGAAAPSAKTPNLNDEWQTVFEEAKATMGVKAATKHRLNLEQKFRKAKFDKAPKSERQIYQEMAAKPEKPVDSAAALITGLPYLNLVVKRFTNIADVPIIILMGARDPSNPDRIVVYQDSYTPAPSDVPDFLNGPDRFGAKVVVPAFRKYLAKCFNTKPDDVANAGIPLPTPSTEDTEPSPAEEQGPELNTISNDRPDGLASQSSIQFTVTPAPKDWTIPSKELETIKKNLKLAISESFKRFHGKNRCHFTVLGTRSNQFVDPSFLPTTRLMSVLLPDGSTIVKEGEHDLVVYPTDPQAMHWYQAKAYFDLLKNPNRRFQWLVEQQTKTPDLHNLPPSVRDSLKVPDGRNGSRASKPARSARSTRAQDSEPEAEMSAQSADSSPFSVGTESSLPEVYQPETEYVLRPQTISRFGRLSAPGPSPNPVDPPSNRPATTSQVGQDLHKNHSDNQGNDESPTASTPTTHPASTGPPPLAPGTQAASSTVVSTSQKLPEVSSSDAMLRYTIKPLTEPDALDHVEFDSLVKHVRELSAPTGFQECGIEVPDLPTLLKHCARLDKVFPARSPSPLSLPGSDQDGVQGSSIEPPASDLFWENLNNPHKPVPTFLAAEQLAVKSDVTVGTIVKRVGDFLITMLDILEGHDLAESTERGAMTFVSWTDYLLIMARYLTFAESIEPAEGIIGTEEFIMLHERTLELAVIHLTIRYCAGAIASHITNYPAPSPRPSPANAISTLGTAWIELLKRTCRPINKTVTTEVLSSSWAYDADPSSQLSQNTPFFHLATPAKRWFTATATSELYDAIEKLDLQLHKEPTLFETKPTWWQFTVLASIFAVNKHEHIRGSDEAWLSIVDHILDVIEHSKGGAIQYEIEQAPIQPPPTLAPSVPKSYAKPRRSGCHPKSAWALGDVALVDIKGKQEEVIFVRKQKYGSPSGYLVMAWQDPIREIKAADGEGELPLPPYDDTVLIKHGPTNPVEMTHLRVPGLDLGQNLGIGDMLKPEYAGYFAQFKDVPDDVDPNFMEQRGFKPPEYFAKKYFAALATKASEKSLPDTTMEGPEPTPLPESHLPRPLPESHPGSLISAQAPPPKNPAKSAEPAHKPDAPPPAPDERGPTIPPDGPGLCSAGPSVNQGSHTLNNRDGDGEVQQQDQEEPEDDEEEVENALIASEGGSEPKAKAKRNGTASVPKPPKAKAAASKKEAMPKKPASSTPATGVDSGPKTRASTRNHISGSSATEAPAPTSTGRRVSTRSRVALDTSNGPSGSTAKRSNKK